MCRKQSWAWKARSPPLGAGVFVTPASQQVNEQNVPVAPPVDHPRTAQGPSLPGLHEPGTYKPNRLLLLRVHHSNSDGRKLQEERPASRENRFPERSRISPPGVFNPQRFF